MHFCTRLVAWVLRLGWAVPSGCFKVNARRAAPSTFWSGKRVMIAGASSGLGEALALELSARGANLVLGARRADSLAAVAQRCNSASGSALPAILSLDVTAGSDSLAAKAKEASTLLGGNIDVLCYVAGIGQRTNAAETSPEAHQLVMSTNFEGAVSLSRALLPEMMNQGRGHLMVVSSVQGFFGQPGKRRLVEGLLQWVGMGRMRGTCTAE